MRDFDERAEQGRELDGFKRAKGKVSKNLTVGYAIRLSPDEFREFTKAANERGMSLAELMRSATRGALAGEVDADKAAAAAEVRTKAQELVEAAARL